MSVSTRCSECGQYDVLPEAQSHLVTCSRWRPSREAEGQWLVQKCGECGHDRAYHARHAGPCSFDEYCRCRAFVASPAGSRTPTTDAPVPCASCGKTRDQHRPYFSDCQTGFTPATPGGET